MATVAKVVCSGTTKSEAYANVFYILDDNDNAIPQSIADFFVTDFVQPIALLSSDTLTYTRVEVTSLTAANPYTITNLIFELGQNGGDPMPTGVHLNVFLNTTDFNERGGAKMIGGQVETNFTNGIPGPGILASVQTIFDDLLTNINVLDIKLAVLRSVASLPGFPVAAVVDGALVRGGSTNNRRGEAFVF